MPEQTCFTRYFWDYFYSEGGPREIPAHLQHIRSPPQPQPGGLVHAQSPEGKCGTSSVLSGVEDPCQVTSDQNQLLFAL